jgi:small nuclear ribonucleoprotein (snRNP)-like protein
LLLLLLLLLFERLLSRITSDIRSCSTMAASLTSQPLIRRKRKVQATVLNFMDGSLMPLSTPNNRTRSSTDIFDLLRRAVNERKRIEVLTRDCRGIYGILIGWLIVFDKHMNLIMTDVDEVFRRLTDGHDYLEFGSKHSNASTNPCNYIISTNIECSSSSSLFVCHWILFVFSVDGHCDEG